VHGAVALVFRLVHGSAAPQDFLGCSRGVHVDSVSALSGFLLGLQGSGATVEPVFDY
jgi:hypothetical protein